MNLRLLFSLLLGRYPMESQSLRRYASIVRGGATAIVAKFVAMGAGFASVPLTLHHLGAERYGLWATLFSMLSWLSLADLGLTNGLMAALSQAFARQRRDLAREYISAAFWGLSGIAVVVAILIGVSRQFIDWSALMHISSGAAAAEFRLAVTLAAAIFVINLPFTIVGRVFVAAQRPELANLWAIASTLAGLLGLAAAIVAQGGLAALVLGYSGAQAVVTIASAVWLFTRANPELIPKLRISVASMHKVFGVAGAFFVSQLATLMLFQSGNLILAHNLGPRYVVSYQITWLLTQYVTIPQQLISASVWATIGEAYAKDDIQWIRRLVKRYSIAGFVICVPLIVLMLAAGGPAVELWAGPDARPSRELLCWMAAWASELVLMHPIIAVLGGTGRLREYSLFAVAAAVVAVTAATIAVRPFGPVGVIAAIVLSYLTLAVAPAAYLAAKTLRLPLRQLAPASAI